MKKFLTFVSLTFIVLQTCTFAYSSGFEYMVNVMQVEKVNVNGLNLNEDIYVKYNIFVYGSPLNTSKQKQKWKTTSKGNWTLNGGVWQGSGTRGEYWILGEDYAGNLVHNEIFPDDYNSGTSPLNWNYREIKDAALSWEDTTKYQYDIQRDYMLHTKLSRFGVTYDLTATDIGLNKARVESYATWGSAGSIYTEKPGEGKIYWVATFSIPPMAGDANLNSILDLSNGTEYIMEKDKDVIEIPLNFGAYVDNLSEYAKAEHIKVIEAELKVNGVKQNVISDTKTTKIIKDDVIVVNRNDYKTDKVTFDVECNSFLSTCFAADPVKYATKKVRITVILQNEKVDKPNIINNKNCPKIYSCTLKRVTLNSFGREKCVDLFFTRDGKRQFICAGQVLRIEVRTSKSADKVKFNISGKTSIKTFDDITKKFEWDDPIARREKTRYTSLNEFKKSYNLPKTMSYKGGNLYVATYLIPYGTTQTLHSWNSLREQSKDAFKIDESKLFTRKENPYEIVISAYSGDSVTTKTYDLDVAERWDELYNRDISKYVK